MEYFDPKERLRQITEKVAPGAEYNSTGLAILAVGLLIAEVINYHGYCISGVKVEIKK